MVKSLLILQELLDFSEFRQGSNLLLYDAAEKIGFCSLV
jgi:hypothetical protein